MKKSDQTKANQEMASSSLLNIRDSISSLDSQLISLLGQRRAFSQSVAKEKQHINKPLRDQAREQQLLESLIQKAGEAGLDSHYITRLFNAIIEDSVLYQQDYLQSLNNPDLKSQQSKSLAVLGGKGAYSYLAAKNFFCNSDNTYLACSSFDKVLKSVASGKAEYGVIPIENTTSGGITEVYDLLLDSGLTIIGEEKYAVNHCLISSKNAELNDIKIIAAHPEASIQCSRDLKKIVSANMQLVESTAHALLLVASQNLPTHAAIASAEAAELFDLKVLQSNITNQTENYTRFLVLAKDPIKVSLSVQCKTSIAISTGQKAGSLADALGLFRDANIPLSRLESRPIPHKPWEQMFYIDLEGNISDKKLSNTIEALSNHCLFLRVLGSYPTEDISATQVSPHSLAKNKLVNMQENKNIKTTTANNAQPSNPVKATKRKSYHLASREHKPSNTIIKVKNTLIGDNHFTVIAGPCAVESQQQIMSCAQHASETGVAILRGGCFKPRTSPYSFQGLGFHGLDLMQQAGKKYSLPIITEVMSPEDVKAMAKQADVLQIGARNMQNFSLLKAVGEVNIPVMLKRGLMATIDELLNAAEYILSHGNLQVFLCERGIRTFETATRSTLDLSAIPVLKQLTHLPIIVDPSHAVGKRDWVLPMAKAAKAVGAHGIIVEFHPNPEEALSDGPQALRYKEFAEMMEILYR